MLKKIISVTLLTILVLAGVFIAIGAEAQAEGNECVPSDPWTETVTEPVAAQHYSLKGNSGIDKDEVPLPPPAPYWQANTTQEPHLNGNGGKNVTWIGEVGIGLHYTSSGSKGKRDWFYFQPEVKGVYIEHPGVVCPPPEPTGTPTDEPSETPTDEPTDEPSETPTDEPSEEPSETPTDSPSETPTDEPSETPSETPTDEPSDTPSVTPTAPVDDEPSVGIGTPTTIDKATPKPVASELPNTGGRSIGWLMAGVLLVVVGLVTLVSIRK